MNAGLIGREDASKCVGFKIKTPQFLQGETYYMRDTSRNTSCKQSGVSTAQAILELELNSRRPRKFVNNENFRIRRAAKLDTIYFKIITIYVLVI